MKLLYLECSMGASGDMLMGALYELCPDQERFLCFMNQLFPEVSVRHQITEKCGIKGNHISVLFDGMEEAELLAEREQEHHKHPHTHHHDETGHVHHHSHSSLQDIWNRIDGLDIPDKVKQDAKKVYERIALAEASVHGSDPAHIHFHEVGSRDAVCDVVGVCYLMHELAPDKVIVSPVCTGFGEVHCAHGILPVPAPATALLLENVPSYAGAIRGELCTPTGAALIGYFADEYGSMPVLTDKKCGYGMGTKDFAQANCLRAFYGRSIPDEKKSAAAEAACQGPNDRAVELSCNIDDMTGEDIGFALDRLWEQGALDVFTVPVQMKKNRPGIMITVICRAEDSDGLAGVLLKYTTTFGVRRKDCDRYILNRNIEKQETPFGGIRIKTGEGYRVLKSKPEFEDVARCAREHHISVEEVRRYMKDGGTGE